MTDARPDPPGADQPELYGVQPVFPADTSPPGDHGPSGDGVPAESSDEAPGPGVRGEVVCESCGYSLSGLPESGACPECAHPIAASVRRGRFIDGPAEFCRTLAQGAGLILLAMMINWVLGLLGVVAGAATGMLGFAQISATGGGGAAPVVPPAVQLLTVLTTAVSLLSLIPAGIMVPLGWWKLTSRSPAEGENDSLRTPRMLCRAAVITAAALSGVPVIGALLVPGAGGVAMPGMGPAFGPWMMGGPTALVVAVTLVALLLSFVAVLVASITQMLYLRRIGPRFYEPRIERWAKFMVWLYPLLLTVGGCVCLGPLAGQILLFIMLLWVRRELRGALKGRPGPVGPVATPAAAG